MCYWLPLHGVLLVDCLLSVVCIYVDVYVMMDIYVSLSSVLLYHYTIRTWKPGVVALYYCILAIIYHDMLGTIQNYTEGHTYTKYS